MFGLCFGLTIGVEWSNVAELVETDILSDAITFIQVCTFFYLNLFQIFEKLETSIGTLTATYLGGYISDTTGDYSYVFYIAGILLLSGKLSLKAVTQLNRCCLCRCGCHKKAVFVWRNH